jgi:hypothetical protein
LAAQQIAEVAAKAAAAAVQLNQAAAPAAPPAAAVAPPAPAVAVPAEAPGSKLFGGLPKAKLLQGVTVPLSPPLAKDSTEAQQSLAERLTKLGLTARESALFIDRYGPQLFDSTELVVACRLDPAMLDEKLPLSVFPQPAKTVRVGLVIVRNLDPQMGTEAEKLVGQLGDAKWAIREAAQKRLLELGAVAFPALKKGLANPDPEVVIRSERILLRQNQQPDARAGAAVNGLLQGGVAVPVNRVFQAVPAAAPAVLQRIAR